MSDLAWALQTARQVGPVAPPHIHAHPHPIHKLHTGPLHSTVAGRTDHLPSSVPNGSYVWPADIVSALGEGNTMAGFKVAKRMFEGARRHFDGLPYAGGNGPYGQSGGPYGMAKGGGVPDRFSQHESLLSGHGFHRSSRSMQGEQETRHYSNADNPGLRYIVEHTGEWEQRRPNYAAEPNGANSVSAFGKTAKSLASHLGHPQGMAAGGQTDGVPVAVAGGEHVLAPHEVAFAGNGDLDAGHRALDEFVLRQRAKTVKTLKGLPGPKRD